MWYCLDCKEYFEVPECETSRYWSARIGYDGTYEETICRCPLCGSEDFEEARDTCDACGETVYKTTEVGGLELCPYCYEQLKEIIEDAASKITGRLDKIDSMQAKSLICYFYGEEDL